ncbi:MAG: ribosomal-processing cysteine protease Prp [Oscillospiraceae bacterium]|nr:ribosomal-processing cysteine protease Prp [Oscillospiraceae bacterium]
MINARFFEKDKKIVSFSISGHAGFEDYGKDIVCAGVTSAVMTVINGITECAKVPCDVKVLENEIICKVLEKDKTAECMLSSLKLQLEILSEQYDGTINITVTEV